MKFSIIFPIYQNELNVPFLKDELIEFKKEVPQFELEAIFVDDGSTDNSFKELRILAEIVDFNVILIRLTRNFGQGPAVRAGFDIATGDVIGTISSDQQDPILLFKDMIKSWEGGSKLVLAARKSRDDGLIYDLPSKLFFSLFRKFVNNQFPSLGCDVFLIDKTIKEELLKRDERGNHIIVILLNITGEFKVHWYERKKRLHGKNQTKFWKRLLALYDTSLSNSYLPIRFVTFLGVIIGFFGILYALYIIGFRLFYSSSNHPKDNEGWASIVTLISFFSGIILFSLGIVGEYLWRVLENIRKPKMYQINEVLTNRNLK